MHSLLRRHRHNHESPDQLAGKITATAATTLRNVASLIAHPRSLARPDPAWRPPSIGLPAIASAPALQVCVTRYRLSTKDRDELQAFGYHGAYVVIIRITNRQGLPVPQAVSDAWMTAIAQHPPAGTVHQLIDEVQPTYAMVVGARFQPVPSPASLYGWTTQAA
ncbi:hypothetical protein ACFPVT_00885 [Corynebacterium choanae]|nr:hypothetical protein [Corynebacterium choanae]